MKDVAREMNLSETAFPAPGGRRVPAALVHAGGRGGAVRPCHARGGARAVGGRLIRPADVARFHTLSGLLTAARDGDWIGLDFPATPATPAPPAEGLLAALGLTGAVAVARSRFDYLVEVADPAQVRAPRARLRGRWAACRRGASW